MIRCDKIKTKNKMSRNKELYELSKELVYQMTGNYTEDVQNADFQIAWTYLEKAMDYIQCCESDSEQFYCYLETDKKCEKQCNYCLHIEGSK